MTLRHMRVFVSVFRQGSITRAAEELHLTQPAVSLSVKELENYYGIKLFERYGRRIFPTEGAKMFYGYAVHIISLFDEMETRVRSWDERGILRVGASITVGTFILPQLAARAREKMPGLRVEAVVCNSAEVEAAILDNRVDLGLIEAGPSSAELAAIPFMEDALCAIAAPGHPLAGKEGVTLRELASYPFLMREKGSAGREVLDAALALRGIAVRPVWESASTQAIVHGVSVGLGIAVLPSLLVRRDIAEGTVAEIGLRHPIRRQLHILHHKNKFISRSIGNFIALCRDYGAENPLPPAETGGNG